jgi:D-alanyl-D-alanine carboxypeptidase/D-alanyl-D-alanine-endopeptidase (penicillin-binding protein 4)
VLVEDMHTRSDNDHAEAQGRQTALASKLPATFDGVAAAIAATLKGVGVEVGLRDASGLSPLDRLRPSAVTALLVKAATDPRYAPVLSGLPVAGFDGTLADRYRTGPTRVAAGEVRAKTGTLNGVSALAGLVVTRDGRLLAFDLTADGVALGATAAAQKALDRVATALASCGCT